MTHQSVSSLSLPLQFQNLIYLYPSNIVHIQYLPKIGASQEVCPLATAATFIITKQNFQAWASFKARSLDCNSTLITTG